MPIPRWRIFISIRSFNTLSSFSYVLISTIIVDNPSSISKIVNLMKSYTTYHIWKRYPQYLRKQFWKEHTFWTDGYFACSVGNVSEEMLKRYIGNQG
ncbi:MAG: IS200/IS605 family transposase [Agathobacter sp.]|uniref:IS200/IS605 family transposase n=1 Tax=Agathobacter sp. TaxID=2021311 RepID=UPI003991CED2